MKITTLDKKMETHQPKRNTNKQIATTRYGRITNTNKCQYTNPQHKQKQKNQPHNKQKKQKTNKIHSCHKQTQRQQ